MTTDDELLALAEKVTPPDILGRTWAGRYTANHRFSEYARAVAPDRIKQLIQEKQRLQQVVDELIEDEDFHRMKAVKAEKELFNRTGPCLEGPHSCNNLQCDVDFLTKQNEKLTTRAEKAEARLAEAGDVIETAWYRIRNDDDLARDLQCLRDFLAGGEEE